MARKGVDPYAPPVVGTTSAARPEACIPTAPAHGRRTQMPAATHTVTIRRPASEVFAFIADGTTAPRWRPGVLDIALVSGTGVGAIYRQGARGPGGRRVAADYEITAYEPDRRLSFSVIAGPVRPTGEYRLEEAPDGTHLTFSLAAELSFFKRLVMAGAVQRTMDAEVAATERLKQVLEGSGSADTAAPADR